MVESTLVRIPSVLVQSQHRSLISHLQPLTSHLSPFAMPTHPRSYSPVAAEKLRRALLALAAAATATVAGTGCTVSGARIQKPGETVPPPTVEGGSGDSIRCGQQLYVPESEPTPPSQTARTVPLPRSLPRATPAPFPRRTATRSTS